MSLDDFCSKTSTDILSEVKAKPESVEGLDVKAIDPILIITLVGYLVQIIVKFISARLNKPKAEITLEDFKDHISKMGIFEKLFMRRAIVKGLGASKDREKLLGLYLPLEKIAMKKVLLNIKTSDPAFISEIIAILSK